MTFLQLIRKNLFRKKLRTTLTVVSIFVAFLIFGVLAVFQSSMNAGVDLAGADRLIVTNKINFTLPMPIAYVARTGAVEGVERVAHASWFGGYYQEPKNFLVTIAIDPAPYLDMYPEYVLPQRSARLPEGPRQLIVGKVVADTYGWKVGDRVPIKSSIWRQKNKSDTWDFTVAGIVTGREARVDVNFVLFHYDYFKETRDFGGDTVGWMLVKTADTKNNERIMKTIDAQFANSPFETETKTEQAFNKAFIEQMGDLGFIIVSVVGSAFGLDGSQPTVSVHANASSGQAASFRGNRH
jgi:putative ABC transport system permease protein